MCKHTCVVCCSYGTFLMLFWFAREAGDERKETLRAFVNEMCTSLQSFEELTLPRCGLGTV